MVKAKLFSYQDSQIYYYNYGINPEKHFDKLCEKYGSDTAVKMLDENMIKAWEKKRKRESELMERENPFLNP